MCLHKYFDWIQLKYYECYKIDRSSDSIANLCVKLVENGLWIGLLVRVLSEYSVCCAHINTGTDYGKKIEYYRYVETA